MKVLIYAVIPQFQIRPHSRIIFRQILIPNSKYRLEFAVQTELCITDWSIQREVYNGTFNFNCAVKEKVTSYSVQ